jgi:hypothetical protein
MLILFFVLDSDCAAGQTCSEGRCLTVLVPTPLAAQAQPVAAPVAAPTPTVTITPGPQCTTNEDCSVGIQVCRSGICVPEGSCTSGS